MMSLENMMTTAFICFILRILIVVQVLYSTINNNTSYQQNIEMRSIILMLHFSYFLSFQILGFVSSCHKSEIYLGEQSLAHPYGWRNDRWLHNVQDLLRGDVQEALGESPSSLQGRRRFSRSIETGVMLEGRLMIKCSKSY